ncbi:uncharacterized protein K489DRAFT_313964 [Dissoconium aciculare CBS 342.82]|uniref:Fatty acid hydroxylase domain-containing protein n=1 Tax=Dissoconium aciculare CBS 342.82 TaxID=1314786 RepID=A0A6J3MFI0_9PEZI|nr:uncharacterized protein K489DRAFT_313964 [Dissoconium aciculare CBS 342.82]KAF1825632.1 hypothetical protein K489DRAFT_313964 [Dissoconium aciculare CBS 342.82]
MASTWREKDPSTWNWQHRFLNKIDNFHNDNGTYPVFKKTDPIPWFSHWAANRWILAHAAWPILIQLVYTYFMGKNVHPVANFFLYFIATQRNAMMEVKTLQQIALKTGFLDGDKHSRDKVPDVAIDKITKIMPFLSMTRPALFTLFGYRRSAPIQISPWLPVELIIYSIVLDFFFYVYHRATHEIDGLWQYHRRHHTTKHPIPILAGYADHEQEAIEIAIIPVLTFLSLKLMGFPMGFYDWWICAQYILFTEIAGHSGLRTMSCTVGPAAPFLYLLGAELSLEDHDLHHREGWRKSGNYGKQTRLWDRIFGTCVNRVEAKWENVDFVNQVKMPWF